MKLTAIRSVRFFKVKAPKQMLPKEHENKN